MVPMFSVWQKLHGEQTSVQTLVPKTKCRGEKGRNGRSLWHCPKELPKSPHIGCSDCHCEAVAKFEGPRMWKVRASENRGAALCHQGMRVWETWPPAPWLWLRDGADPAHYGIPRKMPLPRKSCGKKWICKKNFCEWRGHGTPWGLRNDVTVSRIPSLRPVPNALCNTWCGPSWIFSRGATRLQFTFVTGVESFILLSGCSRKNPRRSTPRPCSEAVQEWNKRTWTRKRTWFMWKVVKAKAHLISSTGLFGNQHSLDTKWTSRQCAMLEKTSLQLLHPISMNLFLSLLEGVPLLLHQCPTAQARYSLRGIIPHVALGGHQNREGNAANVRLFLWV